MTSTSSPTPPSPSAARRPFRRRFVIASGVLVLIVVFAVAVVVDHHGDASPDRGRAAPASGGCRPADTSQQIPRTPPAGIGWTVVKSVAVPVSRTAGPLVTDGDVARCFAHTPTGALIAAWQITIRHLLCDDWQRVTDQQVMPGTGRDAYEKRRAAITGDTTDPGTYGQVAGYQFLAYTPGTAAIQLVTRFSDGTMQASALTMKWSGGDWRLQLQPDGAEGPDGQPVQSLDGFTSWGGV